LNKILVFFIKVSISLGLLAFLLSRTDAEKILFYIRTVKPQYFLTAIFLFLFVMSLGFIRWVELLKAVKQDLPLKRILISYCGGLFFNVFLPSSIGGDIVRTADLALHTKDSSSILASVFIDRISGFVGLVSVGFIGFFLGHFLGFNYSFQLLLIILFFTAILVFIFVVLFSKRVFNLARKIVIFNFLRDYLARFHDSCHAFRYKKAALAKAILLSFLLQGIYSVVFWLVGLSLGINLNLIHYLFFVPIISTITILPISIGGLGLRDNAGVVLFGTLGVAADRVVAMTLLNFSFLFFIGIVGGVIYALALFNRRSAAQL
jgi:uncharacterized protein (TIRG00374 family)